MGACEKCWGDAYMRVLADSSKSQAEHYQALLIERKDNPCSLKDQVGQFEEEGDGYLCPIHGKQEGDDCPRC